MPGPMKHVLIVDDSPIIRKFARLIFETLHYRVSDVETAKEALERLKTDPPELILIDWILPGASSHELIGAIRRFTFEKPPYIVYMVTENDQGDVTRAFNSGADDYLLKPFNLDIIKMKLHEIQVAA